MNNRISRTNSGAWYVLLGAVLFGTTGLCQALAPAGSTPVVIGAFRLVVGGAAMLLYSACRGSLFGSARWPRLTTLLAALSIVGFQVSFFKALSLTGVATGTVAAIGFTPVAGGVIAYLFHRQKPRPVWYAATILSVFGCALLSLGKGELVFNLPGIALALAAGTAYAFYAEFSRRLVEEHPADAVIAVLFAIGAVVMLPVLWRADLHWAATWRGASVLLYLGVAATGMAYTLFAKGLKTTPVPAALTLALAEPLTATLLGTAVLGDPMTPRMALGILAVLSGTLLLARENQPKSGRIGGIPAHSVR